MKSATSIGRWSTRHPWRAVTIWLLFVITAVGLGIATGTKSLNNGAVGEAARGYTLMDNEGLWGPPHELAFVHSPSLGASSAGLNSAKNELERRFKALGLKVSTKRSSDGHSEAVIATFGETFVPVERLRAAAGAVGRAHPQLTIEETGDFSADQAQHRLNDNDLKRAEFLSIPVTLLVLLFAFGGLVAALVPLVLALTAVGAAFGLLGPLSQLFPVQDSAKTVILLVGMAVGVDYALFYVVRSREERLKGKPTHEALETTSRTSGRTVIVSGTTVAIAMAGMFISGAKVLNGIAAGTIAVVFCAVAGSVTVLPAILELLGPRLDRGRIPFLPHLRTEGGGRLAAAIVDRVLRRPVLSAAVSAGVLLALAVPALSLHVSKPSDLSLTAQNDPALKALADVRRAFPGAGEPAYVAVRAPASSREQARAAVTRLRELALSRGITHLPIETSTNRAQTAAALTLPLVGDGANASSRRAVQELRRRLVPSTLGQVPGAVTAVTGKTAEDIDFTNQIRSSLPYVIAFVLVLAFCLLLVAFRSVVVPLKAIVLNLLSVGASYGVLALVFEHHWAEGILGFKSNGAIIAWLPLFLFVVLFGLSMDYHVFILSRVREAVDRGNSTEEAVRRSVRVTAGVVTGAALVMVGVFALFGTLSSLDLKQAGVGLATAVLIDATIIRVVLLPATMKLLGEWNWYLPRVLREHLRKLQLEAHG